MNTALIKLEQDLTLLMTEIRNQPEHERAMAWMRKFTANPTLPEFLHDETIEVKQRAMVAQSLVDILLGKQYERLPILEPADLPTDGLPPDSDEIRRIVRRELAIAMEAIARALKAG